MGARQQCRVWLGSEASIWSHRGYQVRGENVYTDTKSSALNIVRRVLGKGAPRITANGSTYFYRTRDALRNDDTGERSDAMLECRRASARSAPDWRNWDEGRW